MRRIKQKSDFDITEIIEKEILEKSVEGGHSTSYEMKPIE